MTVRLLVNMDVSIIVNIYIYIYIACLIRQVAGLKTNSREINDLVLARPLLTNLRCHQEKSLEMTYWSFVYVHMYVYIYIYKLYIYVANLIRQISRQIRVKSMILFWQP